MNPTYGALTVQLTTGPVATTTIILPCQHWGGETDDEFVRRELAPFITSSTRVQVKEYIQIPRWK